MSPHANHLLTRGLTSIIDIRYRISIMKRERMADRDLYSGLIRLHILHHAVEELIFGLAMAEELVRHGCCDIS